MNNFYNKNFRFQIIFFIGAGFLMVLKPIISLQFKSLPLPFYIFFLPKESFPYYEIHYIFQSICYLVVTTLALNCMIFFTVTTLHLEAQFKVVIKTLNVLHKINITQEKRCLLIKQIAELHNDSFE